MYTYTDIRKSEREGGEKNKKITKLSSHEKAEQKPNGKKLSYV